ncbi:MAG: AAA family ATPase [Gemmataceae bacterium]|nr:AAA family ATPase [Gemmataceae bacterium]MCI0740852.1 AAA family ATPase [Gemmataceae bacterium]
MATLKRIEIKGYRSIKDANLELRELNVLIGANGAGKSNFVSFFKMLNEMMAGRLQEYVGKTGRGQSLLHFGPKVTPQLEAVLEFEEHDKFDTYYMRLFHAANDILLFADETLDYKREGWSGPHNAPWSLGAGHAETRIGEFATQGNQTARAFRRILNDCRVYHFHDTSPEARIRLSCYINDNRWLMPHAGNLAAMLYAYRQRFSMVYDRIVSTMRKILPEFGDFELGPSRLNPNDIILDWRKLGFDYLFGPHQLSDGTIRAMALCTLFLQPEEFLPDVIILDEPELGLHPNALEIVAGLIRAASAKTQVIVATQSQTFLNFFEPVEIVTVECQKGQSRFERLDPVKLKDWLEDYSIGELWQRNVVGGGPLP